MKPRSIIYGLTMFGSFAYFEYWFVHVFLNLPLVPSTTTNNYWEIVGLNVEVFAATVVFLIPSLVLALLLTSIVIAIVTLLKASVFVAVALWEIRKEGSP